MLEEAERQEFVCRMCVMESHLKRFEEKQQRRVQVDGLVEEVKAERQQREGLEGKLAQIESECVKRDVILASNDVRHWANAPSVPGSEAGKWEKVSAAACEGSGSHDSTGHGEGPNTVAQERKGPVLGKSYAEACSTEARVAKTPVQLKNLKEHPTTIVGDSNMCKAKAVIKRGLRRSREFKEP